MTEMKRVLVLGCPGAGKSVFSRRLRDVTGLPLHYLDMLWHLPDKTTVERAEFDARLAVLLRGERWILDGNFQRTLEQRLAACDTALLLDYPLEICLEGVRSRIGRPREEMPWVESEFDPEFESYIRAFAAERRPELLRLLDKYREGRTVKVFRERADAERFLSAMEEKCAKPLEV